MENNNSLTPFVGEKIRNIWHDEQWYFNVSDIIALLTDSKNPKAYWRNLKKRLLQESNSQSVSNCYGLKFEAADGKKYLQDAANTEGILRIVMSVPSPKAEPLKLWLAEQGKQAIDEAENPELLTERQAELYRAKGYTEVSFGQFARYKPDKNAFFYSRKVCWARITPLSILSFFTIINTFQAK